MPWGEVVRDGRGGGSNVEERRHGWGGRRKGDSERGKGGGGASIKEGRLGKEGNFGGGWVGVLGVRTALQAVQGKESKPPGNVAMIHSKAREIILVQWFTPIPPPLPLSLPLRPSTLFPSPPPSSFRPNR